MDTDRYQIARENESGGHKWLGCILGVRKAGRTTVDLNHHLQAASKAFFANKTLLYDRNVHVKDRLRYFDKVVSPVALFGSGHRTVHQKDLHQLDAACRKFLRADFALLFATHPFARNARKLQVW